MNRIKRILSQPEFPLLAFLMGCILLNWPFLGVFHSKPFCFLVLYVFLLWGVAVIMALIVSRHLTPKNTDRTHKAVLRRDHKC